VCIPPPHDDSGVCRWICCLLVGANEVVATGVSSAHGPDGVYMVGWWPDMANNFMRGEGSLRPQQPSRFLLKRLHPTIRSMLKDVSQALVPEPFA